MPISKTDFIRGLQCKKMLWLDAHCPENRIIPPEVQEKLNAGNEFGDKAMGIFGEFIEIREYANRARPTPQDALEVVEKIEQVLDRIKWLAKEHETSPTDWIDEYQQTKVDGV